MCRVVFHSASLRGGGAERVLVLMANEFAARGQDVTLFTWNAEGPNAALLSERVRLVDLAMPMHGGGGYGKLATLKGLVRSVGVMRELQPDAVYSGPEFANLLTAIMLALAGSRAQFFPTVHAAAALRPSGFGSALAIALSRLVAARATRVVGVSDGVGRDLVARGFPNSKVVTINNPLPPMTQATGDDQPWRAELDAMGPGPVIGTAGRLIGVKDHVTLLHAFAQLSATRPARLVIFGEGPLRDELADLAARLGIAERVLLPGYISDPAACYAALDLFVLTSTTEGFGNVLIEAMAAGVPVVSTDAPYGPREIMRDGALGPLVPVGDPAALAEAMGRLLDRPTDAALLRQRAADFAVDKIGDRYLALLH